MTMRLYAVKDVEMNQLTAPVMLRNNVDAKRFFKNLKKQDVFAGCPVEFYCIGEYHLDKFDCPISTFYPPERVYLEDTIDDAADDGKEE